MLRSQAYSCEEIDGILYAELGEVSRRVWMTSSLPSSVGSSLRNSHRHCVLRGLTTSSCLKHPIASAFRNSRRACVGGPVCTLHLSFAWLSAAFLPLGDRPNHGFIANEYSFDVGGSDIPTGSAAIVLAGCTDSEPVPVDNVLQTIGSTRLSLNKLAPAHVEMYVKAGRLRPMGSVKDRLALGVIEAAEASGAPGQTSSRRPAGTRVSAFMVCNKRLPACHRDGENFGLERRKLMRFLGASHPDARRPQGHRDVGEGQGACSRPWLVPHGPIQEPSGLTFTPNNRTKSSKISPMAA